MTKKIGLICLSGLLLSLVAATLVKMEHNKRVIVSGDGYTSPCWSAAEARNRGTLICDVELNPWKFDWQGRTIQFEEAWLEESARLHYRFIWFPSVERKGKYFLVVKLAKGNELVGGSRGS